jgi:hypothetical protein
MRIAVAAQLYPLPMLTFRSAAQTDKSASDS